MVSRDSKVDYFRSSLFFVDYFIIIIIIIIIFFLLEVQREEEIILKWVGPQRDLYLFIFYFL